MHASLPSFLALGARSSYAEVPWLGICRSCTYNSDPRHGDFRIYNTSFVGLLSMVDLGTKIL